MYIIVAGAGLVGSQITELLIEHKHDVVVIDSNREVCEKIYAQTGAMTINGNATNYYDLQEAGIEKADLLVCCLRHDSDNISSALLAKSLGLPRVIACARQSNYTEAYRLAGVSNIVQMTDIVIDNIIYQIEFPPVKRLFSFGSGKAEMYVVTIEKKSKLIGKKIKNIVADPDFPSICVFSGIYREEKDKFVIPRGDTEIKLNDKVFVVSSHEYIRDAVEYLYK